MPHRARGKYTSGTTVNLGRYQPTPEQAQWIEAAIAQADAELELRKKEKQDQIAPPKTATLKQIQNNTDTLKQK